MKEDLRELYQAVILDHARTPRNFRHPERVSRQAHGHNPMCGDQLSVYLSLDGGGIIEDAAFEGKGCAISLASASLMTETLRGRRLRVLAGVRAFPARVKCATLAWQTMVAALRGDDQASSE